MTDAGAQAVCVLGMHRSGTSLTARVLGLLGVELGPEATMLEGRRGDNPDGFVEQRPILAVNEEIFARFGAKWWEMPELPTGWERSPEVAGLEGSARAALEETFGAASFWGFKDPRMSVTLPFWRKLLPPTRYVVCLRQPAEVAASLARRNADAHQPDQSIDLWLAYTAQALRHTDGELRTCVVYDDYFDDPQAQVDRLCALVADVVAVSDDDRARALALADEELRHHRGDEPVNLTSEAAELYTAVLPLRTRGGTEPAAEKIARFGSAAERLWERRRRAPAAHEAGETRGTPQGSSEEPGTYSFVARFDADRAMLRASRTITDRFRSDPRTDLGRVMWFVPSFDHVLRGGLRTIFALAEDLSRNFGTRNVFAVCADKPVDVERIAELVAAHFPGLNAEYVDHRYGSDVSRLPAAGTGICTLWTTAYELLRYNRCAAKLYLVQDWEPGFYAAGGTGGLIEQTYRFGFPILANSVGVARRCLQYEEWVGAFNPGVDRSIFLPDPKLPAGPPYRVVFYGRPRNERNGFSIGLEALSRVKAELGDAVDIVSVGGSYDVESHGAAGVMRNLGVVSSLEELAALYRSCHVGLVLMYTAHPSYQPLEYMASGCVTVTNANPSNDWLLRDRDNCLLAPSTASGVTEAIVEGLSDAALRARVVAGGLETVADLTWERAFDSARAFLARPGMAEAAHFERRSIAAEPTDAPATLARRPDPAGRGRGRGPTRRARIRIQELRGVVRVLRANGLRSLRTYLSLRMSGQFDRDFYANAHPEIALEGADPLTHYMTDGWRRGWDPSPSFSTNAYLAARKDVERAGINPLLHHVRYGATTDRDGRARRAVRRIRSLAGRARMLAPLPEDALERGPLRKEQERTAVFLRRYAEAAGRAPADDDREGGSESVPIDRRRVLIGSGERPGAHPSVDVVVCVHDALSDLRRCVRSLLAKTGRPFHLILVDDGSGPQTREFLSDLGERNPGVTVVTRAGPPHGYTLAANEGVRASNGDYVVLLNSDTIVTFGWLDRIVACGESDPSIGIVGPLSNAASHQSVPRLKESGGWAVNELPDFLTADGLAALVAGASSPRYPRFPFLNGFCYAIKREAIDSVGLFDEEHFASGYCEENDFSLRASQQGFELAVSDDAYVFHAKSRSYGQKGRCEIAKRNYQVFLRKHGEEVVNPRVHALERDTALSPLREMLADALSDRSSFARAFAAGCPDPLRIGFVLHGMGRGAAGGVHSIYQETRGMRALGIDARVLVPADGLGNARTLYADADRVFSGFADEDELAERTADRDVLVATHFRSVEFVRSLRERRDDFLAAYYVQDYEPFFFDEDSSEGREALASYSAIPDQLLFAKTQWLCDLVSRVHDRDVAKVEPSIDHEVYRAVERSARSRGPVEVVAMVRPRTWRRRPLGTLRVLDRLQTELGDRVRVQTFGAEAHELRRLAPGRSQRVRHLGLLTREQVADVLAHADVFLDFSSYQAFGRTALEAMACDCAAVVPRIGGSAEYAVDGENALTVDTTSEDAAFAAVAGLAGDRQRLRELQAAGLETAKRFSNLRAALSEYVLFAEEHARRQSLTPSS